MTVEGVRRVAFVGAKGGCGTTLVMANVAASLAHTRTVCAIDLDTGKGDLAALLDLEGGTPVPEVLAAPYDPALLRGAAIHHRSGLAVLGQPAEMHRLARPLPSEALRLLEVAGEAWSLVFLDCGSRMDEAILATLRRADWVVIVATPDVLALRNVVRLRELLALLAVPATRLRLVLNRVRHHPQLDAEEVEATLHDPVSATIAEDVGACERALSEGQLLVEASPGATITHDLDHVWLRLNGEPLPPRRWHLPWAGGSA